MTDLRPWIRRIEGLVEAHRTGEPGAYRRWRSDGFASAGSLEANPYGCADAVNLLETIGRLPRDPIARGALATRLAAFQDPGTGAFREATHHEIHTTAHCLGALFLLGAKPRHPLRFLAPLESPGTLERFLEALPWRDDPWLASHRGAGLYAARLLAGEASASFEERYFAWLLEEQDARTGLFRRGCVDPPYRWGTNRFPHLAGTFHYLFNLEHAGRPLRYPAALVDTCLDLFLTSEHPLGTAVGFAEIDWVYCLTRSVRRSGHREADSRAALEAFCRRYLDYLLALDLEADDGANDLHRLFGAVCALAELARALPGRLRTESPLQLVLDRRPFI